MKEVEPSYYLVKVSEENPGQYDFSTYVFNYGFSCPTQIPGSSSLHYIFVHGASVSTDFICHSHFTHCFGCLEGRNYGLIYSQYLVQ